MADNSLRRVTLKELLALQEPVHRLTLVSEFRQYPAGGGDRVWKCEGDVPGPPHPDPLLDQ